MGNDIKAKVVWFNEETEAIESEEVSAWRIWAQDDLEQDTGICIAIGNDDSGRDVVLTEETLAALGYVPAIG